MFDCTNLRVFNNAKLNFYHFEVMYIGKFEDGTIFERKGSNEDPFEYICCEGTLRICYP